MKISFTGFIFQQKSRRKLRISRKSRILNKEQEKLEQGQKKYMYMCRKEQEK